MAAVPGAGFNQIPFEVPNPPREFGQDGGKFYRLYDNLAEEIDEDTTKGLKEQLDGLLIFAGLFAGVNSAFLALTLPLLLADPADDTNALLVQNNAILLQLMQGRNDTGLSNPTLPSTSFTPSPGIFTVNTLFSFSLALAIISAFLAVLGRQWLVYYRKRSGGGADRQRWEQLKRFLGAERWRLELVLDDILPSLLQIGLIIFCASLILYLQILNPTISRLVGIPMGFGLAIFILSAVFTVWDRFCPFQSPLSHLFALIWRWVENKLSPLVPFFLLALGLVGFYVAVLLIPVWLPFLGFAYLIGLPGSSTHRDISNAISSCFGGLRRPGSYTRLSAGRKFQQGLFQSLFRGSPRNEVTFLQVVALKRTICVSDDPLTLLCAAANIFTIDETGYLEGLWSDETFHSRFLELCTNPYQRMVQLLGRDRAEIAVSAARLYRGALAHIVLSLSRGEYSFMQDHEVANDVRDAIMSEALVDSSWLIPSDIVEGYSPAFIEAALASWMLRACVEYIPLERIAIHLTEYSDSLSISSWKLTSLLVCILAGISEEDIQSSYTYPKRLDTVGSVMTTYTTFNPPSLASQPAPPVVHSHPTSESIRAGPSNDTVVGVTYPFETMVHRLSVRPAGIGRPSQHIAAEQPEGQAFVGRSNFPGQVNVVASQPIVFEEPTKHPSSNSSSEPTKGDPPTGQTIQEAKIDSAARHAPIESPRNFSTAESMVVELPRGPTPPPHPIETFSTGQPVAARLGSSIPYTYPVSELEVFSRNDPPRRLNIAALRFAYTRDVGMTLSALELVAVNLAKQLYGGDFDCHRILLNILICVREVTINENRHPDTTIEDKFGLLGVAEQVLRIEGIHDEVRAAATRLRMDFVTMLRKHFVTGDLRSKIHPGLLILFGNFFFQLRARGESSRSSNQEDIVVLHLLGPLLQELYTYPTNVWEIQNVGLRHYEIAKLKNLCDEVRQVYYTFRAKVNRTSRTLQSDVRYSRHPEVSCCHRMDELNLCLPSQDFSELDRFPDHSFLPTMYDYGSLDDLVTPIWRVPLSPIASIYSRPILSSSPSQAPYASDSFLPAPVVAHSPLQLSDDEQSAHPDILTS